MKHFNLFISMLLVAAISNAQTYSDFEEKALSVDQVWNGSDGSAQGSKSGNIWFPTVWDTSWGGFLSSGFAVSTMTDTLTEDYTNQYSAITGKGYDNSASYGVNFGSGYFLVEKPQNSDGAILQSAYLTNGTYPYMTLKNGNFAAKKFGGANGEDPDYFRIIFKGYWNGIAASDSVVFYLADFRSENNEEDYIVKDWTLVDFSSLGRVDSVSYYFESSDTGTYGINTPLYFCMDHVAVIDYVNSIASTSALDAQLYPNPAQNLVYLKHVSDKAIVEIMNSNGAVVMQQSVVSGEGDIDVSHLSSGIYFLRKSDRQGTSVLKLIIEK